MISDEQIKALAVASGFKLNNETGDDLKPYVYEFARDMIALAQEVRPLEFLIESGVIFKTTDFGQYHIAHSGGTFKWYVLFNSNAFPYEQTNKPGFDTYEEAASYVQADFASRVLANLKYGGTNDTK